MVARAISQTEGTTAATATRRRTAVIKTSILEEEKAEEQELTSQVEKCIMRHTKKDILSKLIALTEGPIILVTKCLSLKQPYAELIVSGRKTIELRKWNTKFRGQFLIHASKTVYNEACKLYNIDIPSLITGAIIGSAMLYDVKIYQTKREFLADQNKHFAVSTYSEPMYGFLLSNGKRFDESIPLKGRLKFFDVNIQ